MVPPAQETATLQFLIAVVHIPYVESQNCAYYQIGNQKCTPAQATRLVGIKRSPNSTGISKAKDWDIREKAYSSTSFRSNTRGFWNARIHLRRVVLSIEILSRFYVYKYLYMCICIHVHIYIYVHKQRYIHIYICGYVCIHIYACMYICRTHTTSVAL